MDVNLPFKFDMEIDALLKGLGLNLENGNVTETLKTIANGELPQLDEYIGKYLENDKKQIIELIRITMAMEIGKDYVTKKENS